MFESITENLTSVFKKMGSKGKLTEKNIEEGLREVKMALLQADVHFKIVKQFIQSVTEKSIGQEVIKNINPAQLIIKIVHDELVDLMGPVDHSFSFHPTKPTVVMVVGLQGSGKTTTCAKLATYFKKKERKPLMVAADVQRPAAIAQLHQLGETHDIPVYSEKEGKPPKICQRAVNDAASKGYDTVILDTAGRLHIDEHLMGELDDIKTRVQPDYIFLVTDAMTGQDAVNSGKEFNALLDLSGIIMTKLDGDARGGAALSIKAVTGKPLRFIGTGEKNDNLEDFYPDRMASRILGMGDVVSLVEKAQDVFNEEQAAKLQQKIMKNDLNIQDFYEQLQQMKKMGPLGDLIKMIPGIGANVGDIDESELGKSEAIIQSMTIKEREHPHILNGSRRLRIAKGCGMTTADVNSFLKQFEEARKMMKQMKKMKGGGLMNMFGGQ